MPEETEPTEELNPESESALDPRDEQIAMLSKQVEVLAAALKEAKDEQLRAMAESQNVQRRMRQQHEIDRKYGAVPVIQGLIPILDNFDRTLMAGMKGASQESLIEGVRVIERQFAKVLENHDLVRIEAKGQPFDPEVHEAIATLETNEHPDDLVIDELESGYKIHDRVIRPARVRVAKQP